MIRGLLEQPISFGWYDPVHHSGPYVYAISDGFTVVCNVQNQSEGTLPNIVCIGLGAEQFTPGHDNVVQLQNSLLAGELTNPQVGT